MVGEIWLSFDNCLWSICELVVDPPSQSLSITQILKCLKFPPLTIPPCACTDEMSRRIFVMVTDSVFHGIHKVVTQSSLIRHGHFTTVLNLFIYLGFYVAFNTVQVISRRVFRRAEETSTYSSLGFCTANC